ncbi:hypothetical protein, partial [Brucella haematophila]|uniref:hypothetical protein n=1 Tax=Brucella haematophila TaxID=419474 RepID=UPI0035BC5933
VKRGATVVHAILSSAELYNKVNVTVPRYVRFNPRTQRSFWIAGYTAWEGYRLVAESPDLQRLDTSRFAALSRR